MSSMEYVKDDFQNQELEDEVLELQCNIDDMTGEDLAYAMDKILDAGALDVYTIPIGMKKGRTGIMLSVLCKTERRKEMAKLIFRHTTTIGIRQQVCSRMVLGRREMIRETKDGKVRVKQSGGYGVVKEKMEFEDLKQIAEEKQISIREVRDFI